MIALAHEFPEVCLPRDEPPFGVFMAGLKSAQISSALTGIFGDIDNLVGLRPS